MKQNAMRNIVIIIMLALACVAQVKAVDYKGTYKGSRVQKTVDVTTTTTTPTVSFQSTSVYSGQFSNEQQSMLNSDGSVNGDAYMGASLPGRSIRKSGTGSGSNPGTPDDEEEEEEEQQPLGDVMWPLMLCACAYLIVRATRKEEKIG